MAITEEKIRERILSEIWTLEPQSKKIRRNPLVGDRSKWAGKFRHEVEIEGEPVIVTHAWIVRRIGYKPRSKNNPFEQYTFEFLGFKGFEPGDDSNNSEDEWQKTVEKIARRFAEEDIENPVWEFENEEDEVTTEDVDFPKIGLINPGQNEYLHFGGGRLVVNIHRC